MSASDLIRRRVIRAIKSPKSPARSTPVASATPLTHTSIQRALSDPRSLPAGDVLNLQRMIGNNSMSQMLQGARGEKAGMTVGATNDRFEQQADHVAAQATSTGQSSVQRAAEVGSEGGRVSGDLQQRIAHAKGGSPAPEGVRRKMEQQTGADFSGVRVHHDREADGISKQLAAKAATHGNHIFLARDQSPNDARLMAHELTHTIQQGAVKTGDAMSEMNTAQRTPEIQRDDDEDEIKKLKGKRTRAKVGAGALKALDWITTAPLHLLDELSITDLHLKDFGNFVRTGKTRKKRQKDRGMEGLGKHTKGTTKRAFGRTGLRGYLSGTKTHKMMYTNSLNGFDLPWKGKANPFTQMNQGVGDLNKKSRKYSDQIYQIKQKRQQQMQGNDDGTNDTMPDEEEILDVLSETVDEEDLENA